MSLNYQKLFDSPQQPFQILLLKHLPLISYANIPNQIPSLLKRLDYLFFKQVMLFHTCRTLQTSSLYNSAPQPFWHQGPVSWKTIFPWTGGGRGGDGFRMMQAHYIYCALYFHYYYTVIYNEIIIQLIVMQNHWEPWACFHLPLTDRVLIWVCKELTYYGPCGVKPLC